jgi:hypothetical protein
MVNGPGWTEAKDASLIVEVCAIKLCRRLFTALNMMAVHFSFWRLRHVSRLAALAGCLHAVSSFLVVAFAARLGAINTKLLSFLARL